MSKNIILMKASKSLADHNKKNNLIPRLQEGEKIVMIKTKDGYRPLMQFRANI